MLVAVASRIGWLAIVALTLAGQAVVLAIALQHVPGITVDTFGTAFAASWIAAIVGTAVAYVASAGTDDALAVSLARRHPQSSDGETAVHTDVPGIVFVQMDGVPFPVLRWALQAGAVPTIRRWLQTNTHVLREWTVQLPCTTPASQQGILHGTIDRVPAFRWYDRELGRVLVANRPADASVIESRASNGLGLLADGGTSISNLFSGDAPRSAMTMSRLSISRGSPVTRRAVAWFVARPEGFARSLTRTVGEIGKERFQARRQRRRGLEPSTHRGWDFAILRAVTNGVLRDLNTAVVADEMLRGTNSIYVDYVDYDEIAHHAGLFRPESLAALDGVDRVLATLETVSKQAPRPYYFVVVSDHGQSQGQPFAAAYGIDLGTLCQQLTSQQVRSVDGDVEGLGRAEQVVSDLVPKTAVASRMTKVAERQVDGRVSGEATVSPQTDAGTEESDLTVLGSGNLGLVYQHGPDRMTLEQIEARWPRLVPGLVGHEGIAFVAGSDAQGHGVVVGPDGRIDLVTGVVTGVDPLAGFPPHAGRSLASAMAMAEAPDLYVNSSVHAQTLEVHAFEPLVGCHGGLGGWQDDAVLICPTDFAELADGPIHGADELHRVLVSMLTSLGHRRDLVPSQPVAVPEETS